MVINKIETVSISSSLSSLISRIAFFVPLTTYLDKILVIEGGKVIDEELKSIAKDMNK